VGGDSWAAASARLTPCQIVVREASERDVPSVLAIEGESFADPWSADSFVTALDLDRMPFLVAEEVGAASGEPALLGYVIALVVADEGEIADIAVASHARRRGVGGILLDRMSAELIEKGVRTLYLEVRESNSAARRLYETRQFAEVGRRRGYYRLPVEDALVLRRDLDGT
jgi:ribosomal-protein-alanine N-acetyltransferase